ncbi:putative (3R)-2'-hydroxyisoflavanone reductase [Helianthus annuus]|uniref:Dihydroflavonol 4-reductase n=1 Tax=Helianthus annuus TaxID=4232 RepID=A0A251V1I2_HELAN|nr:vestitone reductase [Helianthus annuus]KAF5811753.1 putative (3R)-2'-hydroxyisoflavanone reductase [Helianthus annuus]
MEKGIVCVTGGNGFVASWLIKRLLEDGYYVNTTVRSHPDSKKDVSYLTNLPKATENLKIFDADLNKPETFEAAIRGCIGVFHVAHPTLSNDSVEVLTEKTVKGALGILQACVDSKTVKKVVYTSSISAIMFNGKKHTEVIGEESWSDIDFINSRMEFGAWYHISKTMTEKAILEFGEKEGLDVVTIHPTFVHGSFLGPECPKSVRNVMAMIFGDTHLYAMLARAPFVHVDDVASSHIHLFEHPNAVGRYICSKTEVPIEELYKLLSTKYPEYEIPNIDILKPEDAEKMMFPKVSSQKLLGTGFQFKYGIEEMFDDAIDCCKRNNII